MIPKEKIFEPAIRRIITGYQKQISEYRKLLDLSEKQMTIKTQQEIYLFTSINAEKEQVFERIAHEESQLKKAKEDIVKALALEAFTISELKKQLANESIDELYQTLLEVGEIIKKAETAEFQNEENLKKILHVT